MKKKILFSLLLCSVIAALPLFSQQPCTFKGEKTIREIVGNGFVEHAISTYPPSQYLFQSDTSGNINWMLLCPDPADERCSVFQRTVAGGTVKYHGLKFRPGQEIHLQAQPYQTVKVASFDDFNSGLASYPVIIFDQPYYNVFYLGYWSYLPESALKE